MKANSLEELVTNSNITGELRNYTDWHTRLVKFAQLVADWQKEQMLKDAISCEVDWYDGPILNYSIEQSCEVLSKMGIDVGDKVRIVVLKEKEEE